MSLRTYKYIVDEIESLLLAQEARIAEHYSSFDSTSSGGKSVNLATNNSKQNFKKQNCGGFSRQNFNNGGRGGFGSKGDYNSACGVNSSDCEISLEVVDNNGEADLNVSCVARYMPCCF